MTGIIVTGGKAPVYRSVADILSKSDFIIAADSGLETLVSYGIEPDIALGDFDSLIDHSLLDQISPDKIIKYKCDKDFTDTELALDYLSKRDFKKKIIIGGGGGRLDHQIALYSLFSREIAPALWITPKEKIFLIEGHFSINIKKNTIISLFPVGRNLCQMTSSGLKWELDGLEWYIGGSGISNIALDDTIIINMISGRLIMIIPLDE